MVMIMPMVYHRFGRVPDSTRGKGLGRICDIRE